MSEKIFTIPINEAFDKHDGCPMCRLHQALEETNLSYVLGAAMMEPDVRIKMNELGFCHDHFAKLRSMKNKLALALILESHLADVNKLLQIEVGGKKSLFSKKDPNADAGEKLADLSDSCFACKRIRSTELRYFSNIAYLWDSDPKFHEKLKSQPYICVSHTAGILEAGKRELKAEKYQSLYEAITTLNRNYLEKLRADVTSFTVSFDHRNAGVPLTDDARESIEKALEFLN